MWIQHCPFYVCRSSWPSTDSREWVCLPVSCSVWARVGSFRQNRSLTCLHLDVLNSPKELSWNGHFSLLPNQSYTPVEIAKSSSLFDTFLPLLYIFLTQFAPDTEVRQNGSGGVVGDASAFLSLPASLSPSARFHIISILYWLRLGRLPVGITALANQNPALSS